MTFKLDPYERLTREEVVAKCRGHARHIAKVEAALGGLALNVRARDTKLYKHWVGLHPIINQMVKQELSLIDDET